jgi:hypothetical protein
LRKTARKLIVLILLLIPLLTISATLASAGTNPPAGGSDSHRLSLGDWDQFTASIVLTKTVSATAGVCGTGDSLTVVPGGSVHYCFEVGNTGIVTFTTHTLTDTHLGTLFNNAGISLPPGATYTFSQTEIITNSVVNTATWTAGDGITTTVQAADSASVAIHTPTILMTKTVSATPGVCGASSAAQIVPGQSAFYCYTVHNTGLVTVTQHTLVDDKLGTLLNNANIVVPPGATYVVSATALITNPVVNSATWTASDPYSHSAQAGDTASVTIFNPAIVMSKTANTTPGICQGVNNLVIIPGTLVNYCYRLTNTGQVTVTTHTLTDNKLGLLLLNQPIVVPPGQSFTYSTTEVITSSVTNVGTWTAKDNFGHQVADIDPATVTILQPTIILTKTVSGEPGICAPTQVITVTAGSDVTYCYTIQNSGQVTVTSHTLVDSELGTLLNDEAATVPPGGTYVFSTTVAINEETTNTATWTAEEPFGNTAQSVDSATVFVTTPGMNLIKTISTVPGVCPGTDTASVVPGTSVDYCYELQNTGSTTFTWQTLVDDQLGTLLNNEPIIIAPGNSLVISETAVITQLVTNVAVWTTTDVFSNVLQTQDSATADVTGISLVLTKTVSAVAGVCAPTQAILVSPGASVTYCFTIENTGQVSLETHTLVDDKLGLLLNGSAYSVPPGGTLVFSTTVVVNTSVTNNANWTAADIYDNPAVDEDSATVTVIVPVISVDPASISLSMSAGQTLTIPLTIENAGGAALNWTLDENWNPGSAVETPQTLGDEVFRLNFGQELGNDLLLGVEYASDSFWVTAAGVGADLGAANLLYRFDNSGNLTNVYTQTTVAAGFGWRDLAFDGNYLYGSDGNTIEEIDPSTGAPTGSVIASPISLARAIAYDPAADHFWVANFGSMIYEIDRSGMVVNSFPNNAGSIYGLAWDDVSPGGPYLWAWTSDSPPKAVQLDPSDGQPTGVQFSGANLGATNTGAGAAITASLVPGKIVLIGMHQAGVFDDTAIAYDLGIATGACAANTNPWVSVSSTGGTVDPFDEVQLSVVLDTTGLSAAVYHGYLCILSNDPAEPITLIPLTLTVGFDYQIFLPVIQRNDP